MSYSRGPHKREKTEGVLPLFLCTLYTLEGVLPRYISIYAMRASQAVPPLGRERAPGTKPGGPPGCLFRQPTSVRETSPDKPMPNQLPRWNFAAIYTLKMSVNCIGSALPPRAALISRMNC